MNIFTALLYGMFFVVFCCAKKHRKPLDKTLLDNTVLILSVNPEHPNHHEHAQPFDFHWWSLAASTILPTATIALAIFLIDNRPRRSSRKKGNGAPCYAVILGYLFYLHVCTKVDSTFEHISNPIPFIHYSYVQSKIVNEHPHFRFQIECYHKSGNKKRVTHTASEEYYPAKWRDESPSALSLYVSKSYVFVEYNSMHYFGTKKAERNYFKAQKSFLQRNTRDTYQSNITTFVIPTLNRRVMYLQPNTEQLSIGMFWLFTLIGLHYPYVMYLELYVVRYQQHIITNILK